MRTLTTLPRIVFAGTPVFAEVMLAALVTAGYPILGVYTQPDRPAGRGQKLTPSPVKTYALTQGLPVYQPSSLKEASAQQTLAALAPDFLIVAAYGLILPQAVLDIPTLGCLNVHASLLPRWRGAAPIQRALLAGDTETGITLMAMEAGLDTGPMLYKTSCTILPTDTSGSLHDKLAQLGATTLLTGLANWGRLTPEIQDASLATYAAKLEKAESRLNWQQPAATLARQIRVFLPTPGVYAYKQESLFKVFAAEALATPSSALPGTILRFQAEGLEVATGEGILRLTCLQLPGHKALPIADFIRGHAGFFTEGAVLV